MPATPSHWAADQSTDLKVIHLLRAPVGGLFRHVCDLAREQSESGLQVGIVHGSSNDIPVDDTALESLEKLCRLGIHSIPMRRNPGLSDVGVLRDLSRICKRYRPRILHGHGAKGAAYARLLASGVGAKAIYTPHGGSLHFSYSSFGGILYLTLERLLKNRTDGLIFESEFARQSYLDKVGQINTPFRVIHNGLYEEEFTRVSNENAEYDFVFVGELRTIKGIYVLLEAASETRRHRNLKLLIVGDGEEEQRLKSRIHELSLDDTVELSGSVHPATQAFARGRCLVTPSLAESLPYIVIECLAVGMPVLTTRVGGIPEIFGRFADQLLPPDDPHALADAMLRVLEDPENAKANAEILRDHVREHFRVADMVRDTIGFYRQIAADCRNGS